MQVRIKEVESDRDQAAERAHRELESIKEVLRTKEEESIAY